MSLCRGWWKLRGRSKLARREIRDCRSSSGGFRQADVIESYIAKGMQEARNYWWVAAGPPIRPSERRYITPTLLRYRITLHIAQEEIFGPVGSS